MDAVFFYLGDSYFKWNKVDQSVPYFTKLVTDYPKSAFVKQTQERLREIEAADKAKKQK
jgi:outer membrane protein assembly factor BamD